MNDKITGLMKDRVLLFDGAMGTALFNAGMQPGERSELFGAANPEMIKDIHRRNIEAGSDIITTNTFGISGLMLDLESERMREALKRAGISGKRPVNQALTAGLTAARESSKSFSSGNEVFVALDIGPAGKIMGFAPEYDEEAACRIFREQIEAAADGADLILFETFQDTAELEAGLRAARESGCKLPVFCSFSYMEGGRTFMGATPDDAVRTAEEGGAAAVGINCSFGPEESLPIIEQMLKSSEIPVFAQPNAGLPKLVDGAARYEMTPEAFAITLAQVLPKFEPQQGNASPAKLVKKGIAAAGGCCGTDERFVTALRLALESENWTCAKK
jgi:5-methyltetrahydrofolate--homocysteine methyltransferase